MSLYVICAQRSSVRHLEDNKLKEMSAFDWELLEAGINYRPAPATSTESPFLNIYYQERFYGLAGNNIVRVHVPGAREKAVELTESSKSSVKIRTHIRRKVKETSLQIGIKSVKLFYTKNDQGICIIAKFFPVEKIHREKLLSEAS